MHSVQAVSAFLVLIGIVLLSITIGVGLKTRRMVPAALKGQWLILIGLKFFFLAGYALFLVILAQDIDIPLEFVTGSVFLVGAFFVFLVISLAGRTIFMILAGEEELSLVNKTLLEEKKKLELEAAARKIAEEQAQKRLTHLSALHTIDTMITASLDLRETLRVFLDQALTQLRLHAADILLLSPHTLSLDYFAGRGFARHDIKKSKERLGQGSAGLAALERRIVQISDLRNDTEQQFVRQELIKDEGFIAYFALPLVAKGEVKGVLELFHRTSFSPDPEWFDFLEAFSVQAAIAIDNLTLFNHLEQSHAELILAYDTTIEGWARALELRDEDTQGHTERVTELTLRVARAYGMNEQELVHVRRGALLHDIGKMGVPDSILMKNGPLTEEEQAIMQRHPAYAFEMLLPIAYLRPALDIPYCHHERWDGSGYPRGLKALAIPLAARIFSIVDIWDALTSERRYHPAWPRDKVLDYLRSISGIYLDPKIVTLFLSLIEEKNDDNSQTS